MFYYKVQLINITQFLKLREEEDCMTYPGLYHVDTVGPHELGTLQQVHDAFRPRLGQRVVHRDVRPTPAYTRTATHNT